MNGHFAAVGDGPTDPNFEHGIQVIDGDKEFTFVTTAPLCALSALLLRRMIRPSRHAIELTIAMQMQDPSQ